MLLKNSITYIIAQLRKFLLQKEDKITLNITIFSTYQQEGY